MQERLEKAEKAIGDVMVRKQGKPRLTSRSQVDEQVQTILSSLRVEGLLQVDIQEEVAEQPVRAYRGKLSSPRQIWSFQVHVRRNQEAIERAMKVLGWRVYATNQPTAALGLPGRSKRIAMNTWSSATLADSKVTLCLWGRCMCSAMIIGWGSSAS